MNPIRRRLALSLTAGLTLVALWSCKDSRAELSANAGKADTLGAVASPRDPADSVSETASGSATRPDTATAVPAMAVPAMAVPAMALPTIRALYVNRFAAQSSGRMHQLLAIADSTEINALVIDMKDEFGLNYVPSDSASARNAGTQTKLRNVKVLLDSLKAHDVLAVARLVVYKDSVASRVNPDEVIRRPDGSAWRDHKGLSWVNPYSTRIQEYNLAVAEELVRMGFGEIQWDYIRFPEPYKSLPPQVFPGSEGQSKPDAIAAFLKKAQTRLNALGARSTADIFGLVTTVPGPLEIAQHWEKLAPVTDVLLPMVYPSHYPRGALGVARPNAAPYAIVNKAIARARQRNEALGLQGERVRPYLQAFSLGQPPYGADEVRQQIKAVQDAGYNGWVLWHPGSKYEPFVAALARQ